MDYRRSEVKGVRRVSITHVYPRESAHSATVCIIHILFLTVKYVKYAYEKMALQYVEIRLTQFII